MAKLGYAYHMQLSLSYTIFLPQIRSNVFYFRPNEVGLTFCLKLPNV